MADSKALLRARIRAVRSAASTAARSADTEAGLVGIARAAGLLDPDGVPGSIGPVSLTAYVAAPGEPDVAGIRAAVRGVGGLVLLPIPRRGGVLDWAPDRGAYRPHPRLPVELPIGEPIGTGAAPLAALGIGTLLVPALAVDGRGVRLGQGGGYYDRLLEELAHLAGLAGRALRIVAVVHDAEVLPEGAVPREAHDQLMSAALTPTRYVRFGR